MAFDAASAPVGAVLNPLAFVTTTGALDAYRLARLTNAPADYMTAAHALAKALQAERDRTRPVRATLRVWIDGEPGAYRWGYEGGGFQFSGFSTPQAAREDALEAHRETVLIWVEAPERAKPGATSASAPKRRERPTAGLDLAAPLAKIPRAKAAVGAFICRWTDGSETRVTAVVYHAAKLESRWAAAFQAADQLRRLRMARRVAGFEKLPGRFVPGPCGVLAQSDRWLALIGAMPMPGLLEILCENTADVHIAAEAVGAGDIDAAARHLDELRCVPEVRSNPPAPAASPGDQKVVAFAPAFDAARARAQLALAEAVERHQAAQKRHGVLLRPDRGPAIAGDLIAEAYAKECAAFVARRAAERELASLAA